jgi:hypothetical protein
MQIHGPGGVAALESITLNPGNGRPFADIEFTLGMSVFIYSAAEADELIKAAVTAKGLLLTAQAQATADGMVAAGVARNEAAAAAELAPVSHDPPPAVVQMTEFAEIIGGAHPADSPLAPPAPYSLPALTQEGR